MGLIVGAGVPVQPIQPNSPDLVALPPTQTSPVPVLPVPGEQGAPGKDGQSNVVVYQQAAPAATWTIPNPFARAAGVELVVGGQVVDADVSVSPMQVVVVFANPTAGYAVLT